MHLYTPGQLFIQVRFPFTEGARPSVGWRRARDIDSLRLASRLQRMGLLLNKEPILQENEREKKGGQLRICGSSSIDFQYAASHSLKIVRFLYLICSLFLQRPSKSKRNGWTIKAVIEQKRLKQMTANIWTSSPPNKKKGQWIINVSAKKKKM